MTEKNVTNEQSNQIFDDGFVKIYPYKEAVVVEKYKGTLISGEQQHAICSFIAENYGLSKLGIVVRSVKYGMSMEAMDILKSFMQTYEGDFAFVDPSSTGQHTSKYSNNSYLIGKVNGTYSSLKTAYEEINKSR